MTNKKPNGGLCQAAADCGSNYCVDGLCCSGTCTGTCQSCAVPGFEGSCVNVPPGAQDTNATTPCGGSQYCDAAGVCQSGLKPNGAACAADAECGSNKCVDGVCCNATCAETCYTCNLPGGTPGECAGLPTGHDGSRRARGANYCDGMHNCTTGKKPNGAICASDLECALERVRRRHLLRERVPGQVPELQERDRHLHRGGRRDGPARWTAWAKATCTGTCNGQGACRWGPQGLSCAQAGCQATTGLITGAGTCDGAGNCSAVKTRDCNGFALLHRSRRRGASARPTARAIPTARSTSTARA